MRERNSKEKLNWAEYWEFYGGIKAVNEFILKKFEEYQLSGYYFIKQRETRLNYNLFIDLETIIPRNELITKHNFIVRVGKKS